MPILDTEVKYYRAQSITDDANNGGRMSNNEVVHNTKNNLWPDISQSERTAGSLKYRKLFIKNANASNLSMLTPKVFVEKHTPGGDNVTFFAANQTNQQGGITGSERKYGCGQLNANVSAGANSMQVATEDVALGIFVNGDKIRISDKADINALSGNEEYLTITGVPSYAGNVATISFTPNLANGYNTAGTRVASVYEPGNVVNTVDNFSVTSAAGTHDHPVHPVVGDNIGSIEQNWTLTFTGATAFGVVGDTVGSVGSGTIGSDFAPANGVFSRPYFTLPFLGFGGTFQAGDTITFSTHPASIPLWCRRQVPAGTGATSNNTPVVAVDFETP